MWVFTDNAFISLRADMTVPDLLDVRARFPGDIEKLWPQAVVTENYEYDYRFSSQVRREDVASVLGHQVRKLRYHSLTERILSPTREEAYLHVWFAMREAQKRSQSRKDTEDTGAITSSLLQL